MRLLSLTPLAQETRAGLPTDEAAAHLNRTPQTLRKWACRDEGPIKPRRIGTQLHWPTDELRKLCGVGQ